MKGTRMKLFIVAVLGVLALCGSAWAEVSDPIAHWKFDEGSGTTAVDCVGGNDGIVYGAQWTAGQIDGALNFDGNGDYVDISGAKVYNENAYTIMMWVKGLPTAGGAARGAIYSEGNFIVNDPIVLWMPKEEDTTKLDFWFRDDNRVVRLDVMTDATVFDDTWKHIAFVDADGDYAIFVNGQLDKSGSYTKVAVNSNRATIGALGRVGETYFFNGTIDDVRIYDRALSAEEVEELYIEGLSNYERTIIPIEDAIAEKEEALDRIDDALDREEDAYSALEKLFESGDYGDFKKRDIVKAKQEIHSAMQRQGQSADVLEKSIEGLYDALAVLGWEPNLVSHWKFDEGSGTIAADCVGGNHGTLFGDTVWTSSPIDGALSFDGDGDYVDCGNGASVNNLTRFSVSLWFKADVIPSSSGDYFISQRDLSSVVWTFILHGDYSGRVAGAVIAGGSNAISTADFIPNIGEWYHGAMTYDDLGDRKIRIYINGTEQSYFQRWPASGTMASNPSVHVAIGNRIGGGRDFGGSIDEVMIFNRILSPEEIEQLYQDGLDGSGKSKGK